MSGKDSEAKRRRQPRRTVRVLVDVIGEDGEAVTGVIRDLSVGGAKFLTNAKFEVAATLRLSIRSSNTDVDSASIQTAAEVVRVETLDKLRVGLWSRAVAVKFERELRDHAAAIERFAALARQAEARDRRGT